METNSTGSSFDIFSIVSTPTKFMYTMCSLVAPILFHFYILFYVMFSNTNGHRMFHGVHLLQQMFIMVAIVFAYALELPMIFKAIIMIVPLMFTSIKMIVTPMLYLPIMLIDFLNYLTIVILISFSKLFESDIGFTLVCPDPLNESDKYSEYITFLEKIDNAQPTVIEQLMRESPFAERRNTQIIIGKILIIVFFSIIWNYQKTSMFKIENHLIEKLSSD